MTTNSDTQVTPGNDQQPNPADPNTATAVPATETDVVDIDALEVAEAKAAAEAEKAASGSDGTTQAQPGAQAQPAKPAPQDQQQPPQGGEQAMIPKARMDEIAQQRDQERQNAAYWRGVAEARAQGIPQAAANQQPPQQQQPTADQRLAAIHTRQDELAAKFDNGEITYSDLLKAQRALTAEEQGIREEVLLSRVKPAANDPPQQRNDALYLDTLTAQLETEHPWVVVFDKVGTEIDWKYLKERAAENCAAKGIDITNGDIGKYNLRREVAELADQLGPNLIADRARARNIAIPGQTQQQGNTHQLSPAAQARANKLDLAANAPPNLQRMSGATGDGTPTDSRIELMNDDEIGNLPEATRRKLLGIM